MEAVENTFSLLSLQNFAEEEQKDTLQIAMYIKFIVPFCHESITVWKKDPQKNKRTIEREGNLIYILLKSKRALEVKAPEINGSSKRIKRLLLIDEKDKVTFGVEAISIKKRDKKGSKKNRYPTSMIPHIQSLANEKLPSN